VATRRAKVCALLLGAAALAVLVFLGLHREDVVSLWRGYRFVWMEEGVFLNDNIYTQLNVRGQVTVSTDGGTLEIQAGRWSAPGRAPATLEIVPQADRKSRGHAINDRGSITGTLFEGDNELAKAFLWTETGAVQELPTLGGSEIVPTDINNQDAIVGSCTRPDGKWRAFLWTPEAGISDLGALAQGSESYAG
jgi:probable HAF family extracellular repeat protein